MIAGEACECNTNDNHNTNVKKMSMEQWVEN